MARNRDQKRLALASMVEVLRNIEQHGTPFLRGVIGGRHKAALAQDVADLLYRELPVQLVEIRIRPENSKGEHWQLSYSVLVEDGNGDLVPAFKKRRSR